MLLSRRSWHYKGDITEYALIEKVFASLFYWPLMENWILLVSFRSEYELAILMMQHNTLLSPFVANKTNETN
jgi:hypothetical protein